MNVIENASLRRLLIMAVTTALLAAEKKLGLEMDAATKAEIAAVVVAYLLASNAKEASIEKAKAAGQAAAAKVDSPVAALDEMGKEQSK